MNIDLLTERDMFLIKHMAYGSNFDNLKGDLRIKEFSEFQAFKSNMKLKLGIVNDLDFIELAFKLGVIVVDDFLLNNISHVVFGVAYNLYMANEVMENESLNSIFSRVYDTYLSVLNINEFC